MRPAYTVQDGHTPTEHLILTTLWGAGRAREGKPYRHASMGYREISSACGGITPKNCKLALHSLEEKLAIELGGKPSYTQATIWRVFAFDEILRRREMANLKYVIRGRGVTFVDPKTKRPLTGLTRVKPTTVNSTTPPIKTTTVNSTTHQETDDKENSMELSSSSVVASVLQRFLGERPDDDGVAALVSKCRRAAPDATDDEIAHFVEVKADQAIRMRTVRNLIGFLQTAAPRSMTPAAVAKLRERRAQAAELPNRDEEQHQKQLAELEAEQRSILADPSRSEEDKYFARKFLGING